MMKIFRTTFVIMMVFAAVANALPISTWNSSGISLLVERAEVTAALGSPDGTEDTMEWYNITGNEGLSRVSLDYLDTGKVQAVALSFIPGSIDLDTLVSIIMGAFPGVQELLRDEKMAVFLGRSTESNEPVYFLAMAEDPDSGKIPELITMTELANRHYQK